MADFALTHPEGEPDEERLREHEADFTPMPVVRQCLSTAVRLAGWNAEPEFICDPASGAGAWAKAMREMWPAADIWAIEKRAEEAEHAERHANFVLLDDAIKLCGRWGTWGPQGDGRLFDLVATNPPFSLFCDYADNFLSQSSDVWLFAPVDANVRGEDQSKWLAANAHFIQRCLWVRGGIGFRGPGTNQDFRQYGLWMLTSESTDDPDGWPVTLLPWLPGHDRRWVTRPGTEG